MTRKNSAKKQINRRKEIVKKAIEEKRKCHRIFARTTVDSDSQRQWDVNHSEQQSEWKIPQKKYHYLF